jgi:hypothetical protein
MFGGQRPQRGETMASAVNNFKAGSVPSGRQRWRITQYHQAAK